MLCIALTKYTKHRVDWEGKTTDMSTRFKLVLIQLLCVYVGTFIKILEIIIHFHVYQILLIYE